MALSVQNGYVVYQRGSKNRLWDKIHREAVAASGSIPSLSSGGKEQTLIAAGQRLVSLADAEQKKEIALLASAGFEVDSAADIQTFVSKFNEILMSKQQIQNAITRLEAALSKEKQTANYRAPSIAVWFNSYLRTALSRNISTFIDNNIRALNQQNFSAWEAQLDNIIDVSIREAFEQMLTKVKEEEGKELYGDSSQWEAVYEASRAIKDFDVKFGEMIRSKIDFSQLAKLFQDEGLKVKRKDARYRNVSKTIDKRLNLSNSKKSRAMGGSVEEFIMQIINSMGAAFSNATSASSAVFSSELMKADTVTLFSYSNDIDIQRGADAVVEQLNETMLGSSSLLDATRRMTEFYNQNLSKLNDAFIVYGSTKLYAMTESFTHGFHGGGDRSLEDAKSIISQAGIASAGSIEKFINAAYNTGAGAIYADSRGEVAESLKAALMGSVAELLFDDWVSIGEVGGGAQAIHVLQLEGIQIPSSVFLRAAGQAMINLQQDMERYVKIHVTLPGAVTYGERTIEEHRYEEVLARWEEQAQLARNQSSFSMNFLANFKQLITQWIQF